MFECSNKISCLFVGLGTRLVGQTGGQNKYDSIALQKFDELIHFINRDRVYLGDDRFIIKHSNHWELGELAKSIPSFIAGLQGYHPQFYGWDRGITLKTQKYEKP